MKALVKIVFSLVLAFAANAHAESLIGRIVGITDGDTLTFLADGNQPIKIRLVEIDCPESAQPYGNRAKQELSALAFGKSARVESQGTDRYGRTLGRVFVDGLDVNAEMIRRGAAWVYRKYSTDQSLFPLEAEAKREKRGLWNMPEAERIPPWEWRHPTAVPTTTKNQTGEGFTCGSKRTCGQMTSCAEARFYLETCGLSRLDRNSDGTPCEALCR